MKPASLPHEKTEVFYSVQFHNGVLAGFYLDLETALACKELNSDVARILKRTIHERIEVVEGA